MVVIKYLKVKIFKNVLCFWICIRIIKYGGISEDMVGAWYKIRLIVSWKLLNFVENCLFLYMFKNFRNKKFV